MAEHKREKILLLTLVHRDFLPRVYAAARTLRYAGFEVHIASFDSYVPSERALGGHITLETLGKHHNVPFIQRWQMRRKFLKQTKDLAGQPLNGIISFCAYSSLYDLKERNNFPVILHTVEIAGVAALAYYPRPTNIEIALRAALTEIEDNKHWILIKSFVKEYFLHAGTAKACC